MLSDTQLLTLYRRAVKRLLCAVAAMCVPVTSLAFHAPEPFSALLTLAAVAVVCNALICVRKANSADRDT